MKRARCQEEIVERVGLRSAGSKRWFTPDSACCVNQLELVENTELSWGESLSDSLGESP